MTIMPFAFELFARFGLSMARPTCRPAAETPFNGAVAGRRGLGAGPRSPSAAGSQMRKNEFMSPAPPERHRTRNRALT